tara:strand:+ start:44770 stop:45864 length:1095 start_codon:yes stop_codon:yes gene_type:complete
MFSEFINNITDKNYIFYTLFFSAFISYYSYFFIIKISKLLKIEKAPSKKSQHKKPISHLGGISLVIGTLLLFLFIMLFDKNLFNSSIAYNNLITISFCSIVIFLTGLVDDLKDLSPFLRLFIQTTISLFLWIQNIRFPDFLNLDFFNIFNSNIFFSNLLSQTIVVLWIVGLINAINWLDGLDGLATGISIFIAIGLFLINLINNQIEYAIFCLLLIGSCLGFLFHNKYPAKILMGDSGSYFLGFSLSTLALLTSQNLDPNKTNLVPLFFLFAVPVLDMGRVIFIRILNKKSPFYGDRTHLHHLFLNKNYSHPQAVVIIYILTNFSVSISLILTNFRIGVIWTLISNFLLFIGYKRIKLTNALIK